MQLLKLKIDLDGQGISRTVLVPADYTLAFLHEVIQTAFGWLCCHDYEFVDPATDQHYHPSTPGEDDLAIPGSAPDIAPAKVAIGKVLHKVGDRLDYTYDFGDGNDHTITCLGEAEDKGAYCTEVVGPDAVEDAAMLGFTKGVVAALSKKPGGKKYNEVAQWVAMSLGKVPESVIRVPSLLEVSGRVHHLLDLVHDATLNA